jgi:hypothetical protein
MKAPGPESHFFKENKYIPLFNTEKQPQDWQWNPVREQK